MTQPEPVPPRTQHTRRMPSQSLFYDRILPLVFVALAVVMLALILIAAGVLLGFVHWQ